MIQFFILIPRRGRGGTKQEPVGRNLPDDASAATINAEGRRLLREHGREVQAYKTVIVNGHPRLEPVGNKFTVTGGLTPAVKKTLKSANS